MTTDRPENWYYRAAGIVTQSQWAVTDPASLHLANAYAKTWRGEDLTPEESAALAASSLEAIDRMRNPAGGDELLGLIAHHRPDILERVDALARELAAFCPLGDFTAWGALQDYTSRAFEVTAQETFGHADPIGHLEKVGEVTAAEAAALREKAEAERAAVEAWAASPEGQARAAAMETPDGGPEGWSTVPPANPDHPCHPSNSQIVREDSSEGESP